MKVVIGTDVFVSSFLNPLGTPRRIVDLWKTGRIALCLCAEILTEYVEVLDRMGLGGEPELKELLELFKSRVFIDFVVIDEGPVVIQADPADDKFLACAVAAAAVRIVSGDKHLKDLGSYRGIPILAPADFLAEVEATR